MVWGGSDLGFFLHFAYLPAPHRDRVRRAEASPAQRTRHCSAGRGHGQGLRLESSILSAVSRILIIDDEAQTLQLLVELFRAERYAVDAVGDGAQARELLGRHEYDVVFTDLRLGYPHDGLEMLELVKKMRPLAQVVIMTAFSTVESSVLAMKAGAYDYITKPFNPEEVLLLAARAA